jgi:hypothetical protein
MNAKFWDHTAFWVVTGWCLYHFVAGPLVRAALGR